jgi:hypothetical protein
MVTRLNLLIVSLEVRPAKTFQLPVKEPVSQAVDLVCLWK